MRRSHNSELRVLVVEDEPGDVEALTANFRRDGPVKVHIEHVVRLRDALDKLAVSSIDVVLLDMGLPDSTGIATVQRVVAAHPDVPIVVLTGKVDHALGMRAVQEGAQDYLAKGKVDGPATLRSLLYAVERIRDREQVRRLVRQNADGMVVVGADSLIRYVNPAAELLFGWTSNSMVGNVFPYPIQDINDTNVVTTVVDGEKRHAEVRLAELEWNGEPALLASVRDRTGPQRARELELKLLHADRLAAIGQLAVGVAHEINNPASFIQVNLRALSDTVPRVSKCHDELRRRLVERGLTEALAEFDQVSAKYSVSNRLEEADEMLRDSLEGIDRVTATVRDLGSFSRVGARTTELLDVNAVVQAACKMASNEIRHRGHLVCDLTPLPKLVGDRAKLVQVFVNLLLNASHAIGDADSATSEVRVRTENHDESVRIVVEDTGCGIAPENIRHVFEPFYTTKAQDKGTGLGLSISAETVRHHGGELQVASVLGHGARFTVVLPHDTGLRLDDPLAAKPKRQRSREIERARVLLVDDEAPLRRALARFLGSHHDVVDVGGGREALDLLKADPNFDVILCDLMMPNVDGTVVYESLADFAPQLLPRLVYLTGGAFTARARDFIEATRPALVQKPATGGQLLDTVAQVVERLRPPAP